jgi:hypothetical protein
MALLTLIGVFLLIFTLYEALQTTKAATVAANETRRSADIALGIEEPQFSVTKIYWASAGEPWPTGFRNGGMYVLLRNFGKSNAQIVEQCLICRAGTNLPVPARYPLGSAKKVDFGKIVKPDEEYILAEEGISVTDAESVIKKEAALFVFGYIRYRTPLGEGRTQRFGGSLRYNGQGSQFSQDVPDDYVRLIKDGDKTGQEASHSAHWLARLKRLFKRASVFAA